MKCKMTEADFVKNRFHYNPDTGIFTRLFAKAGHKVGDVVGSPDDRGYLRTSFNGRVVKLHRLAFLYMLGHWPIGGVDHRDGVVSNNVWSNLRVASDSTSSRNRGKSTRNTSGTVGVSYDTTINKWRAYVSVNANMKMLGCFDTKEQASESRKKGEKEFGYSVDKLRKDH